MRNASRVSLPLCGVVFILAVLYIVATDHRTERWLESVVLAQKTTEAGKQSVPLSSAGTMPGVTLQRTRVYSVKSPNEPKTIVWKSRKLFMLRRAQSFSGEMGSLYYFGSFPTDYSYTSPIIGSDTIYFSLFVGDGYLFALDSQTGAEKKTLKLKNASVSSLAVAGDYVFMGTSDGSIRSIDRNSWQLKWQVLRDDYRFDVTSPAVADGVLILGGARRIKQQYSRADGTLHALNAMSGEQSWMVKVEGVASSPAVDEGNVYFADEDTNLFALDLKTGTKKWSFKAATNIRNQAVSGDRVYFSDERGDLYSVDKNTGRLVWKADKIRPVRATVALENGVLYCSGRDNSVYAIDTNTGAERWLFETRKVCSTPVIAGSLLCFVSADRFLYAVDATTGQEKWKYKCQNEVLGSPTVTDDTIYLLDEEGYMFGLR